MVKPKKLSDDELIGYFRKDVKSFSDNLKEMERCIERHRQDRYYAEHHRKIYGKLEDSIISDDAFMAEIIKKIRKLQKDGIL